MLAERPLGGLLWARRLLPALAISVSACRGATGGAATPTFPPAATPLPPGATDPCGSLRALPRLPWTGRHEALLAACAEGLLPKHGRGTPWQLAASSRLLPTVRFYTCVDRYTSGFLLDLGRGGVLEGEPQELESVVDPVVFTKLVRDHGVHVRTAADAGELARFYVVSTSPYLPRNLRFDVAGVEGAWEVRLDYLRSTPWSPDGREVGGKTVHVTMTLRVGEGPEGVGVQFGPSKSVTIERWPNMPGDPEE